MLLRRLGHRLQTATAASPLSGVACVGTSATLGSSGTALAEMRRFAERVFGQVFDESSVIGEQRRTVEEVCSDLDLSMPIPTPAEVMAVDPFDLDALAMVFTGEGFDTPEDVGDRLLRHPLTAGLLHIASHTPRVWGDVVVTLAARVPTWSTAVIEDPIAAEIALERFVGLISAARGRNAAGGTRPLFSIDVQVWIREVTRLTRSVANVPSFHWSDSPSGHATEDLELPAVYCTHCGRSGWIAVANRAAGQRRGRHRTPRRRWSNRIRIWWRCAIGNAPAP